MESVLIARKQPGDQRTLPPLTCDPYDLERADSPALPNGRSGHAMLSLSYGKLNGRQRIGWLLKPLDAVARLMWLHRQAIRAELSARLDRANFWWSKVDEQWKKLPAHHRGWSQLATHMAKAGETVAELDPQQVHSIVARELLLDTHLAFCNHLLATDDVDDKRSRANWHWLRARKMAEMSALTKSERDDLDSQLDLHRLKVHIGGQSWSAATGVAERLIKCFPDDEAYQALLPALRWQAAESCRRAKNWQEALSHARWLVTAHPDRTCYRRLADRLCIEASRGGQEEQTFELAALLARRLAFEHRDRVQYMRMFVDLHVEAATHAKAPPGNAEEAARREGVLVQNHIDAVHEFLKNVPECLPAYDGLALLHHVKAIKLANGDRPSQALVAISESLAYRPESSEALEAEAKIELALENLQRQMGELLSSIGCSGSSSAFVTGRAGVTFSADIQRVLNVPQRRHLLPFFEECAKGTMSRDAYRNSGEPERIRRAKEAARARFFWLRVGLPRPEGDGEWDHRARAFDEATDQLLATNPRNGIELCERWLEIIARFPGSGLDEIDPLRVLDFFTRQGRAAEESPDLELPPEEMADDDPPRLVLPEPAADGRHVPCLSAKKFIGPPPVAASAPFEFWLWSWQDAGKKLSAAAAICLAMTTAFVARNDQQARRQRGAIYPQIQQAVADFDGDAASAALARYRAIVFGGADERLASFKRLERDIQEWPDLRKRNDAYQRLVAAAETADDVVAAEAAQAFLDLPQGAPRDRRREQVVELLGRARDWPALRKRNDAYQRFAAAAKVSDDVAAVAAAETFLALPPGDPPDGRRDEVAAALARAREWPNLRIRNRAYSALTDARARGDELAVLCAAESFLAAPALSGYDHRTAQVVNWYRGTFADWLLGHVGRLGAEDATHLAHYRTLVLAQKDVHQ